MNQTGRPLEWWEHVQLRVLEEIVGLPKVQVDRYRAHPDEWREMRDQIKQLKEKQESESCS